MENIDDPYDAIKLLTMMLDKALDRVTRDLRSEDPRLKFPSRPIARFELKSKYIGGYRISMIAHQIDFDIDVDGKTEPYSTLVKTINLSCDGYELWQSKYIMDQAAETWYKRFSTVIENFTNDF